MKPTLTAEAHRAPREGPQPFVCCYINGRVDVPPLLLALQAAENVDTLLALAAKQLQSTLGEESITPIVAFKPDGTVLPKITRTRAIPPASVLVLGCGEPFDAAAVPARALRMCATQRKRQRELGSLVRTPEAPKSTSPVGIYPRSAQASPEPLHNDPWRFSPSGRWESPLALRPDRF